jgi:hypothetical protein
MIFCLGWANEDWTASLRGRSKDVLVAQTYSGDRDDLAHFQAVEQAFHDPRYLRLEGKPAFYIYRPLDHPYLIEFMSFWNRCAKLSGLDGIFFVAETDASDLSIAAGRRSDVLLAADALVGVDWTRAFHSGDRIPRPHRGPLRTPYARASVRFPFVPAGAKRSFPCVLTSWDNSPRLGRGGVVLTGRNPDLFTAQVRRALRLCMGEHGQDPSLLFIKSWSEWSEGNYLEPDQATGRTYLQALAAALDHPVAEGGTCYAAA